MRLQVHNEIGPLRQVLVHRPGQEIVRMTQHDLDRMLFDDILARTEAVREHNMMTEIMQAAGATVYRLETLLGDAVQAAPSEVVEELLRNTCRQAGVESLAEPILQWEPAKIAKVLIEGLYWHELDDTIVSLARIQAQRASNPQLAIRPLPNIMFLRDPCISVYDRVVVGRMATRARTREPWLVAFALGHAPQTGAALTFANEDKLHESYHSVEGGDVLVLSQSLLVVGCSERTAPHTLQRMAYEALFPAHPKLQRVYAVLMPAARSVMHLDTILTQIDTKLFLGHEPLIAGPGPSTLAVARLERDKPPVLVKGASVLDVLREELGSDVDLVPCGGQDPLHQEREQWTDGANAIALAPGHIMLYARNTRTIAALAKHGFEEIRLGVGQPTAQCTDLVQAAMSKERSVFAFAGSELSRARGGGRCLTMPLVRQDVPA